MGLALWKDYASRAAEEEAMQRRRGRGGAEEQLGLVGASRCWLGGSQPEFSSGPAPGVGVRLDRWV